MTRFHAIVTDIDDTIGKHGGPVDPKVAAVLRGMQGLHYPLAAATGKSEPFVDGLAMGLGISYFDFVGVENGARCKVLELLTNRGAVWKYVGLTGEGAEQLRRFRDEVQLDEIMGHFWMPEFGVVYYRPESKESIFTLLPIDEEASVTVHWADYFRRVIRDNMLKLEVLRHDNGAIDVMPEGTSKGIVVELMCQKLACMPEEILAFVQGPNDMGLIDAGATPVAVGNAEWSVIDRVRKAGGYVAEKSYGGAITEGLTHHASAGHFGENSARILALCRSDDAET